MQILSVQEVGCALAAQNLTATQYAQMTSALALEGETVTLTAAKVQEAAVTAELTGEQTSAIISTLGLSTAQRGLAISAIAAKVGITALNAVLGLGLGMAIIGVSKLISGISDKIYEMSHKNELLEDSIEGLNTEIQTIESDLKNLNEQLEETKTELENINSIQGINVTDNAESVELQKQVDLLEAQVALRERELELKQAEKNKTIEDWYKEVWQKDKYGSMRTDSTDPSANGYYQKTEEQYFQEQVARAEELYSKQKRLEDKLASFNKSEIESMTAEQLASLQLTQDEQTELEEIQEYFTSIAGELNQQIEGYAAVTDKQKTVLDGWQQIIILASKYSSYGIWGIKVNNDEVETATDTIGSLDGSLRLASESLDDYQDKLTAIQEALNTDMSSTALIDFMQQISSWGIDFDWEKFGVTGEHGVGNLSAALAELNSIITEQINSKYPELSVQLAAISKDAIAGAKGFDTLDNALQTLSSRHSLLDNVANAIKETGDISVETGSEIISAYPQMQAALSDYLSGVKSAEDIYADLEGCYEDDLDLYYQLILQKKELDYSFYEQVYDNLPSWVKSYLDAYQKDFGNFKNLAEAKIKLQERFLELEEQAQLPDNWAIDLRVDAIKEKEKIQEILKTIQDTELDVSGLDEPTFDKDSQDRSGETSIKQIDWATHSIDNLSHHIEYLNNVIDNSNSYKERDSYLKQLISSQKKYNDALAEQATLYRNEYLDAVNKVPQYRKLIESGAVFKIETFTDQDELYEAITKAQELYTSWRDINTAQQDASKSLKEYEEQLDTNWIEHLVSEISLVQNEIDNIDSDINVDTEFHIIGDNKEILNSWKKEKYEQLLDLSADMQLLLEQKLASYQRQLQDVKPETDEYYELQDSIAETKQTINDCVQSQREYNSAILSLPLEQYQKQLDLVDKHIDTLNKLKDKYSDYISAVTYSIDEEIDSITQSKESLEEYYDSLIKPIQEQLDALQEVNDERERALALQKAYYDLEKAQNNLTVKTYVDGQGFVYRPDENAVRDAQDALDSALYDKAVAELQKQIEDYEKIRDALLEDYDEELNRLNDLKDSWSEIISRIESLAMINEFKLQFGDSSLTRIIDGSDTSTIKNITDWVTEVQGELDGLNVEKQNLEDVVDTLQLIVDSYEDGSIDVDTAMTKINEVVAQHTATITALNQQHIESVIDLSNEYKNSIATFSSSEEELSKDTENSNNKIRTAIAKACSQIKNSYSSLAEFISSFKSDIVNNMRNISDAASDMARSIADSAASANSSLSNIDTSVPDTPASDNKPSTGTGILTGLITIIGALFHDGMESGFAAKNQTEANRNSVFKRIALEDLKANEVPAILQVGEAVLTKKQQANVVSNMVTGVDYGMRCAQGINKTSNVNINIPEIHVHEVQNADALAKEITKSFKARMIQEVRK